MRKNNAPLRTVDGATLMSQPLHSPKFVVDTLLAQGLHILAGSPKVGKSWLALWLAVTVAKGEPVWNMTTRQGTSLYLCLEDSVLRIQNRLFEITEDAKREIAKRTIEEKTGARGLRAIVEKILTKLMFEAPSDDEIVGIKITAECVRGEAEPEITRAVSSARKK